MLFNVTFLPRNVKPVKNLSKVLLMYCSVGGVNKDIIQVCCEWEEVDMHLCLFSCSTHDSQQKSNFSRTLLHKHCWGHPRATDFLNDFLFQHVLHLLFNLFSIVDWNVSWWHSHMWPCSRNIMASIIFDWVIKPSPGSQEPTMLLTTKKSVVLRSCDLLQLLLQFT